MTVIITVAIAVTVTVTALGKGEVPAPHRSVRDHIRRTRLLFCTTRTPREHVCGSRSPNLKFKFNFNSNDVKRSRWRKMPGPYLPTKIAIIQFPQQDADSTLGFEHRRCAATPRRAPQMQLMN
ncbi:uncharacterized protein Z519_06632 [Cladophialophora bantiana CBS 173.52]|uniref:Secreted protein n=1 Tax=Cladophialophora bantiana (strain ATCC 10958 / CBS 173.52 / CDC B-1940 / NIH 8579) TaxID=1442370 RepID=A0A0D2HHN9_CLAB1|nr:uncharacterized protein Z519_06632 [Cladophialophora bantiana CBS 173.52]KIW92783.1 hypothetical protein Z519_06632 [Cladophialophora bantiana CBS 173.52]